MEATLSTRNCCSEGVWLHICYRRVNGLTDDALLFRVLISLTVNYKEQKGSAHVSIALELAYRRLRAKDPVRGILTRQDLSISSSFASSIVAWGNHHPQPRCTSALRSSAFYTQIICDIAWSSIVTLDRHGAFFLLQR